MAKNIGLSLINKNQILWMKFDRPKKFNAITKPMYEEITSTLTKANDDKSIKAIVWTGEGDFYSSGNDLTNFTEAMQHGGGLRAGLTESRGILERFVNSLINLEKLLIAAVNGPAVGIAVTTLPLCDYTVASDKATFRTPFTALGQCPEACSSYTFPRLFGPTRASELLLLNKTWDARQAKDYGLVSDVIEHDNFHEHVEHLLYGKEGVVQSCFPNALRVGKALTRDSKLKQRLIDINKEECNEILELWQGEECMSAVQRFLQRSRK